MLHHSNAIDTQTESFEWASNWDIWCSNNQLLILERSRRSNAVGWLFNLRLNTNCLQAQPNDLEVEVTNFYRYRVIDIDGLSESLVDFASDSLSDTDWLIVSERSCLVSFWLSPDSSLQYHNALSECEPYKSCSTLTVVYSVHHYVSEWQLPSASQYFGWATAQDWKVECLSDWLCCECDCESQSHGVSATHHIHSYNQFCVSFSYLITDANVRRLPSFPTRVYTYHRDMYLIVCSILRRLYFYWLRQVKLKRNVQR